MLYDRKIGSQLIGAIIKKPTLFADTDGFLLAPNDFDDRLHRLVFSTMYNLFFSGMMSIDVSAINEYLKNYPDLYAFFNAENGSDFFLAASELADLENINYYYSTIKKYSLLRDLRGKFDISEWYEEKNLDFSLREKIRRNFEESSVRDIITKVQSDIISIEAKHVNRKSFSSGKASDEIDELIESLKKSPEVGFSFEGDLFTTIVRGARRTKFYLGSGASGAGKTRGAVSNACRLGYPIRWSQEQSKWINTGSKLKVGIITTEMELTEIKTLILAYLSEIDEEKILNYDLTADEEKRLLIAARIMKEYKEQVVLFHMPDPSVTQVNTNVKQLVLVNHLDVIFFDYIHTSPQLLSDFGGIKVRDDIALLMLSTSLKNLANELDIIMWSGTQLNKEGEESFFVDAGGIRGSRAICDKTDAAFAYKMLTPEVAKSVSAAIKQTNTKPNSYIDVFKMRRGKYRRVRIFRDTNLGTMRSTDCFVTDEFFNLLSVPVVFSKDKNSLLTKEEISKLTKEPTKQEQESKEQPRQFKVSL